MEKINYRNFDIEPLEFTAPTSVSEIFHIHDYDTLQDLVNEVQSRGIPFDQLKHKLIAVDRPYTYSDDVSCFVDERPITENELVTINNTKKQIEENYIDLCKKFIDEFCTTQQEYNETESRGFSFTSDARAASFNLLSENLRRAQRSYQNQLDNLANP